MRPPTLATLTSLLLHHLLLGAAAPAGAAPSKRPTRLEALRLLQAAVPGTRSVADVLADLGDGRYPVLFVVRGRHCLERTIDGQKEQTCSPTTSPHAAVVRRGADGKLLLDRDRELALPTEAPPWDVVEELRWGITFVKDYDGDGQPELMVAYGYHGPMAWAVGDIAYKHLAIVNLDALDVAFGTVLERAPQASTDTAVHSTWKLRANGAGFDIVIERRSGKDGHLDDTTERWVHGAGDLWHRLD
jgi:hypothetical protein